MAGFSIAGNIVKEDAKSANQAILNQVKNIVDSELQQIETLSYQIGANPKVLNMLNMKSPFEASTYYEMKNVVDSISNYRLNRPFILNFFVYMKNSDYVITSETVYPARLFFSRQLTLQNNNDMLWYNDFLKEYHAGKYISNLNYLIQEGETPVIMYSQSLPVSYGKNIDGILGFIFRSKDLLKLFSSFDLSKGGVIYIEDQDGNEVTSLSIAAPNSKMFTSKEAVKLKDFIETSKNNKNLIVTHTTSSYNRWKYVIALPSEVVMHKLNYFNRLTWSIFFITLFIGLFVSYILSYRNSEPLLNLIRQLKEFMGDDIKQRDTFSMLSGTVSNLISSNKTLQANFEHQKPLLLATFLDRLLRGNFKNASEIKAMSSYIGIDMNHTSHNVISLRIYSNDLTNFDISKEIIEELDMSKAIVREILTTHLPKGCTIHDLDNQTLAILLSFDYDNYEDYYKDAETTFYSIYNELLNTYNLRISMGGGDIYSNLLEIWQSCEQAILSLDYASKIEGRIIWYSSIKIENHTYYYPIELEQRLINNIKSGDISQVQSLLNTIYEENLSARTLSSQMLKDLISNMKSTIIKLLPQYGKDDSILELLKSIDSKKSFDANKIIIEEAYMRLCNIIIDRKNANSNELIEKIKEYIKSNYMYQDLGLYKVSSNFNLSEGYLSHFFKETTNENFTDYLEQIRMQHAVDLLKNTIFNINEIAEKVGYNSAQSFRRAFKRITGVNPTTLRET
jgi:YesN/AraC family two-component response regulator